MSERQSERPATPSAKLPGIAIIGRACRLPGARSIKELWDVLSTGRCTVSQIPADRWPHGRFLHPRPKERGRSYTFAAGVLDDVFGFDPAPFGISPREAEQMDPQQRLLLELAWEAIEDAGIRPSSLAGTKTGVFVGGSALDYGNLRLHDPAAADAYFATGNTLAILSNRISYVFDLHGPSFTVDTACSSSFVALDAAVAALQSGRIDTAIVGGVSVLASPFGFISFSQATMLSQTGLCQAFSAKADGYVRAEGGIVLVLRALPAAKANADHIHAVIAGSEVNSDGRTSGISLPSKAYQAALLEQAYTRSGIDPADLAFIEAHGTGTRAGDPVEAAAIGEVLGQRRREPLPIGSIKTNIGHTEAASGLAGLLKAVLALEHDELPRSLHFEEPNPDIAFDDLNLAVCAKPLPLQKKGRVRYAGISSLGFGGTNTHVIVADPPPKAPPAGVTRGPRLFLLSARSREGLADLARRYEACLAGASVQEAQRIAAAVGHRREAHPERLVFPFDEPKALAQALGKVARGEEAGTIAAAGTAVEREAKVAFIFSGNASQWPGMGRDAYEGNPEFAEEFDKIDRIFRGFSGWSLVEAMLSPSIAEKLARTSVAQPLIFAIQVATVRCLARQGLAPDVVLGHSVGEIAAAETAGILDLTSAVRVIYFRSRHQEISCDAGGMAVLFGPRDAAERLVAETQGLSLAAFNSPRSFTVAGSAKALDQAAKIARAHKLHLRRLDLAYPFHSELMAPVEVPLLADLKGLRARSSRVTFLSTVEGRALQGPELGAQYWWRNVREPVRFMDGAELAMRLGARVFVEIGPSPVLLSDVRKIAEQLDVQAATLPVHEQKPLASDPFRHAAAQALAQGAKIATSIAFGDDPGPVPHLPAYPWQRKPFRVGETCESTGWMRVRPCHPLIGARLSADALEWRTQLDPFLVPSLADHRIDGQVLLPGAAFAEMALAAARDFLGADSVTIKDLEIAQPMIFAQNGAREVLCRVTPTTGAIEILSRARLSDSPYVSHAKAKLLFKSPPATSLPDTGGAWPKGRAGAELYAVARRSGLEFGPAFQQVLSAARKGQRIAVDLVSAQASSSYGLDPARLDSCFHGLILLFEDKIEKGRPAAYLPVRFGEIRIERPGSAIARALIDIQRHDARVIIADFTLLDGAGALIARLRGARYQAMRREAGDLASHTLVQTLILADAQTAGSSQPWLSPEKLCAPLPEAAKPSGRLPQDFLLIEGWATSAAYRFAAELGTQNALIPDELVTQGRLPSELRGWFSQLLASLEQSGLGHSKDGRFVLAENAELPDPQDILQGIAAEHPNRSIELLLAARAGRMLTQLASGEARGAAVADAVIESYETGSLAAAAAADLLDEMLRGASQAFPHARALRILQIGYGPLSWRAETLARAHEARLTILDPNPRRLEQARLAFGREPNVGFASSLDQLEEGAFDLVISALALHRLAPDGELLARLVEGMAPGGVLAAVEPAPSLFRDLVLGLCGVSDEGARGQIASLSGADWSERLAAAALRGIKTLPVSSAAGPALLVCGEKPFFEARAARPAKVLILGQEGVPQAEDATALANFLGDEGVSCAIADADGAGLDPGGAEVIVVLAPAQACGETSADYLTRRCLALKDLADRLGKHKYQLWIEIPGALRVGAEAANPAEAGFWAFARSFANEYPSLDVRRLDTRPGLPALSKARLLAGVILSGTAETEILLDEEAVKVVRLRARDGAHAAAQGQSALASRLEKGEGTGLDRIRWVPAERRAPGRGEVEIAVAATGLNFRDVMWGLSVLPDEMLEDGLAGPTLGLECAGTILAVGEGVTGLKPGDAVVAITGGAFATHITLNSTMVAKVPASMPVEAAVTLPVAFLTAYYALIACARIERGEWVLIHGGAGGVGLAALQIACWRGARVIATASTPEKRDLVMALGAEHVFDARANGFVEDVGRVTGEGVAVVLNSLSGEAMELSIALLKPFGRFIELGKRDFLANTPIGLRPFRNNLSYFGVDLDQLMLVQPEKSRQLFHEVLERVNEGELWPLPYRKFKAREFIDAMRLMQQSGHVGKIVIAPPEAGEIRTAPSGGFRPDPTKTHLITGGCGGFGLATAQWLAGRGARHLVLAGRSGAASAEANAAIAQLTQRGVTVHVETLDVANGAAVERLVGKIGREMPPLAGVFHSAMVLDDALIGNLDAERFRKVLAPKVTGAENLDRATRHLALDYFVLYSSATTAIGNPGQGNYVAANGFLEGLVRQRRAAGLPALAVAWGGIEDVGFLARNRLVKDMLAGRAGVKTMAANDALDMMGEALAAPGVTADEAVLVISEMNWSTARAHLPLLQAPAYSALIRSAETAAADSRAKLDIRRMAAMLSPEEVRAQVIGVITEEIAHILRLPKESVNKAKPLAESGVDSLMAVELAAALEERLTLDAPLTTSASGFNVAELADHVLGLCMSPGAEDDSIKQGLAERHLGKGIDPAALETLGTLVEERSRDLTQILR